MFLSSFPFLPFIVMQLSAAADMKFSWLSKAGLQTICQVDLKPKMSLNNHSYKQLKTNLMNGLFCFQETGLQKRDLWRRMRS